MEQQIDKERASKVGVSLFPSHERIVSEFAQETRRSFSNAVQFIIEDWARTKRQALHDAAPENSR